MILSKSNDNVTEPSLPRVLLLII